MSYNCIISVIIVLFYEFHYNPIQNITNYGLRLNEHISD